MFARKRDRGLERERETERETEDSAKQERKNKEEKMKVFSPWNCEVRFLTALTYEPAEFVQIIPGIIVQKKSENWR